MMRVTIEIVPGGDEERKYTVETLEVVNTGHQNPDGSHRYIYWRTQGKGMQTYYDRDYDETVTHHSDYGALALTHTVLHKEFKRNP